MTNMEAVIGEKIEKGYSMIVHMDEFMKELVEPIKSRLKEKISEFNENCFDYYSKGPKFAGGPHCYNYEYDDSKHIINLIVFIVPHPNGIHEWCYALTEKKNTYQRKGDDIYAELIQSVSFGTSLNTWEDFDIYNTNPDSFFRYIMTLVQEDREKSNLI